MMFHSFPAHAPRANAVFYNTSMMRPTKCLQGSCTHAHDVTWQQCVHADHLRSQSASPSDVYALLSWRRWLDCPTHSTHAELVQLCNGNVHCQGHTLTRPTNLNGTPDNKSRVKSCSFNPLGQPHSATATLKTCSSARQYATKQPLTRLRTAYTCTRLQYQQRSTRRHKTLKLKDCRFCLQSLLPM
jgi:hypothetical protein